MPFVHKELCEDNIYTPRDGSVVGQDGRFASLEPIKLGLRKIRGAVGKGVGQGIAICHDWGPQYIAHDFKQELRFFGLWAVTVYSSISLLGGWVFPW